MRKALPTIQMKKGNLTANVEVGTPTYDNFKKAGYSECEKTAPKLTLGSQIKDDKITSPAQMKEGK